MMDTDSIDVVNMAYSSYQARAVFFEPLVRLLASSKFFKGRYRRVLNQLEFENGILAHSGNSSQESFEGFNPLLVILDEIDAFKTAEDLRRYSGRSPMHSAEGIYATLQSSVQSRFPEEGKTVLLSYLRRADGFMIKQRELAKKDPSIWFTRGATWEVNPVRKREDFDTEYRRDPEGAAMRYECIPVSTSENFFRDRESIYKTFGYDNENDRVIERWPANPFRDGEFMPSYLIPASDNAPRYIHIDIGVSNDSAAVACVKLRGFINTDEIRLPVVQVDFLARLDPLEMGEIMINQIRDVVREFRSRKIGRRLDIRVVTFDQYQSRDSMQILSTEGFVTGYRSVDKDDSAYKMVKELVYTRRLLSCGSAEMAKELRELVVVKGMKVDHPTGGSKDLGDALAGAVANLYDDVFADLETVVVYDPHVGLADSRGFGVSI